MQISDWGHYSVSGDGKVTVNVTHVSWHAKTFCARCAGRRAVERHGEALRRLEER